ncbi:MAG: hypothetical protein GYB65_18540, partial [Chloroflexi bacterium]|nr:hypothetical protein [Chloroflexota bacterium]
MDKAYFQQLYDYTYWADRKVWACVMTLSEQQYRQDIDFSVGPINVQCVHMLAVEYWWIHFLRTGELDFVGDIYDQSRDEVRARWDAVEREVRAYIDALTSEELQRPVKPSFWDP